MGVPRPGRPDDVLRVMTYNVHDLLDDRAAAARVVRAVAPDVLCLQEVPRRLTTELRLPPFARACRMRAGGGRLGTGGTAVLTGPRVTVVERFRGRLPVRFPDRTRGFAGATVALPGVEPVTVVSLHLGLRDAERVAHASLVVEHLRRRAPGAGARSAGDRVVLAGDLNEGTDGPALGVLSGGRDVVSGGVPTYPADRPRAALDVVLAPPSLRPVAPAPVRVDPHDVASGSDHRPVWVDLDVGARPAR